MTTRVIKWLLDDEGKKIVFLNILNLPFRKASFSTLSILLRSRGSTLFDNFNLKRIAHLNSKNIQNPKPIRSSWSFEDENLHQMHFSATMAYCLALRSRIPFNI